jgi:hypothetical protein
VEAVIDRLGAGDWAAGLHLRAAAAVGVVRVVRPGGGLVCEVATGPRDAPAFFPAYIDGPAEIVAPPGVAVTFYGVRQAGEPWVTAG